MQAALRINGMQPPAPMSRDAERQHIQDEGIEFCKRYPDDVAVNERPSNFCAQFSLTCRLRSAFGWNVLQNIVPTENEQH